MRSTSVAQRCTGAVFAVSVLLLAGCSSSSSSKASSSSGSASPPKTISVAVMTPLTGTSAEEGENAKDAGALATTAIDAAAGSTGAKISITYYDTKADPTQAANIAQELTSQYKAGKIDAVVGPADSDEALASLPIFSKAGVPVIGTTPSNPVITQKGYTDFIRMVPSDADQSAQQVAFAYNNLKKRRVGIFYENNDYGQGLEQDQVNALKADAPGASVVDTETYIAGQTRDFSTQITKMMSTNPDVVLLDTSYTEGGYIMRQAKQAGLNVSWVAGGENLYQDFITLSDGAANGVYVLTSFNQFSTNAVTKNFLDLYEAKYKSVPAEGGYTTYDALFLVTKLIDAGTKPSGLIAAAKSEAFSGVGGTYHWTAEGDTAIPLAVDLVKNGQFTDAHLSVDRTGFTSQ